MLGGVIDSLINHGMERFIGKTLNISWRKNGMVKAYLVKLNQL